MMTGLASKFQGLESVAIEKQRIRSAMKEANRKLPQAIRCKAEETACRHLWDLCKGHKYVMSYASFGNEFGTRMLNDMLAKEGKLVLPRVNGDALEAYQVWCLQTGLEKSLLGCLEPRTEICRKINNEDLTLIIIPGLAFDQSNYRLGYGKGFYDRFLSQLNPALTKIGIGFKHQLVDIALPVEPHDHLLSEVWVF